MQAEGKAFYKMGIGYVGVLLTSYIALVFAATVVSVEVAIFIALFIGVMMLLVAIHLSFLAWSLKSNGEDHFSALTGSLAYIVGALLFFSLVNRFW